MSFILLEKGLSKPEQEKSVVNNKNNNINNNSNNNIINNNDISNSGFNFSKNFPSNIHEEPKKDDINNTQSNIQEQSIEQKNIENNILESKIIDKTDNSSVSNDPDTEYGIVIPDVIKCQKMNLCVTAI